MSITSPNSTSQLDQTITEDLVFLNSTSPIIDGNLTSFEGEWENATIYNTEFGLGNKDFDNEGRLITLEFADFFLLNAYIPNAGRGLPRLDHKLEYNILLINPPTSFLLIGISLFEINSKCIGGFGAPSKIKCK